MGLRRRSGDVTDAEFFGLWLAWDRHPGREQPARDFEEACRAVAGAIGVDTSALRELLASYRRAGFSRPAALVGARAGFAAISAARRYHDEHRER